MTTGTLHRRLQEIAGEFGAVPGNQRLQLHANPPWTRHSAIQPRTAMRIASPCVISSGAQPTHV